MKRKSRVGNRGPERIRIEQEIWKKLIKEEKRTKKFLIYNVQKQIR